MKSRLAYFACALIVVPLGLASRQYPGLLPALISPYVGDALWALMVFFGMCAVFPTKPLRVPAVSALAFSYMIEISQLYHAPWIDAVRATRLGGLILGFDFAWSDFVCYAVGVVFGVCCVGGIRFAARKALGIERNVVI